MFHVSRSMFRDSSGQVVLSLVFLIGAIIVLAGVALAFLVISFINSTYGYQIAERAKAAAASGVYDALLRLDRNKDLASSGYSVPVGADSAVVSVVQGAPSAGLVTVTSVSTILLRQRRIRAVVSRDSISGFISVVSWDRT
jgi:hypothetical protein